MATGKKLVNTNESCVDDFLLGFVAVNNSLRLIKKQRMVVREDYLNLIKNGITTIVCGGGSGHEPAFAGYVGKGMLTAAVAGPVFAAPPVSAILNAIRLVGSKSTDKGGTLVIVPNYTGDKLNFGLAIEKGKAEGYIIDSVLVGEDCALISTDKTAGRRGLSGLMLTIKVAGAMADEKKSLTEMVSALNKLTSNLGTIGLCLKECSIPGCAPSFVLGQNEMELGLGAHGEAGVARIKLIPAKETVNLMFSCMTKVDSESSLTLDEGDKVVLLINNLGATTTLEMGIVAFEAISWLESKKVKVLRVFSGHLMTSLEMSGIAFTVLKDAQQYLNFVDAETNAVAWPKPHQQLVSDTSTRRLSQTLLKMPDFDDGPLESESSTKSLKISQRDQDMLSHCIREVCYNLLHTREELNKLDRYVGDGDCGNTLSYGADSIINDLDSNKLPLKSPLDTFEHISSVCETMGGTSGAIYAIFWAAAASSFRYEWSLNSWIEALRLGAEAVSKYGGAEPGDRTLLDPIHEMVNELSKQTDLNASEALKIAATAADVGTKSTLTMKARAGKASYIPNNVCINVDAGAQAVAVIVRAVSNAVE